MVVNLALCGSGLFAQSAYIPALASNKGIKLHTIWSRSKSSTDKLLTAAQSAGIVKSDTLSSDSSDNSGSNIRVLNGDDGLQTVLEDEEIDAVAFVLPISVQPELIIRALKAGKHVLSEKPIAKDVKSARELIEVYEKEYQPKGLIWRVAENFNHDSGIRLARDTLKANKDLGPVLYWQLHSHNYCEDGSKYQATTWRTIPDYQGGFLLDGGVHSCAMLRMILPERPQHLVSYSSLHRTHLPPHDTIIGIARSPSSSITDPHGPPTQLETLNQASDIPGGIGKSSPQGTIMLTWSTPNLSSSDKFPSGVTVTCLNGVISCLGSSGGWTVEVKPSQGSVVEHFKLEQKGDGVMIELREWAEAIEGHKTGMESKKDNLGDPRLALWDVAVIQAMLTSDGKEVDLEELIKSG